jgi:thymidylate synthase
MLKRCLNSNKLIKHFHHDENQYLNLINDVLLYGENIKSRNGTAKTIYGAAMHFDLTHNKIPILTTKKMAWKTCFKELFWFISGSTDNRKLQTQNVNIWNQNSTREFLDNRNLINNEENDLGPIYGHQWRHYNSPYIDYNTNYNGTGVDQLQYIIDNLNHSENKFSRRLIMSSWNPCQLNEMALPPCHVMAQFNVLNDNKLSCSLYQRSGDVGLGVPFNIASYSMLTHLIAHQCGLCATEFNYHLGNCHIYNDHIDIIQKQLLNKPYELPEINILNKYKNIDNYRMSDIKIYNYKYHDKLSMSMRS